jgi:hypothetical protein
MVLDFRDVIRRVEGVLDVLEFALVDASVLVDELKRYADGMRCYATVEMVRNVVPKEVLKALNLEDSGDYVVVSFKRSVKPEDFKIIAEALMKVGGEYISLGKTGFFRIPKRVTSAKPF